MTDHEALEPCRKCGAVCRVEDFNGSTVWMCSQHKWFGGNCPSETAYLTDAAWNTRARPTLPASDDVRDGLERATDAVYHAIYGEGYDPFQHPEAWDFAEQVAKAALATTASARVSGGDKDRENLVARPSDEQLDDDLNDILAPFHWEAWKAALFDSCPDGWPDDDEQEIICRRVDSMAVGEHYEAWSSEVREKIKALSAIPADPVVEALAEAAREVLLDCANSDGRPHIPSGRKLMALSDALAAYRGK